MAGDWIPFCKDLPDKPEVLQIADLTGLDIDRVCMSLLRFWAWVDGQTEDGFVCRASVALLSRFCRAPVTLSNDERAQFFAALQNVGWLEQNEDGIVIPNFDVWMSESAKKRLKNTKRKQNSRNKPTSMSRPKRDKSATRVAQTGDKSATTGQDRTGQINTPFPPCIDNDEMRAAWRDWCQHRREIKKPLTDLAARQQLKKLATLGTARGAAAIYHSIANGYQGIYEPRKGEVAPGLPVETTEQRHLRIKQQMQQRRKESECVDPNAIKEKLQKVLPKRLQSDAGGETVPESA